MFKIISSNPIFRPSIHRPNLQPHQPQKPVEEQPEEKRYRFYQKK